MQQYFPSVQPGMQTVKRTEMYTCIPGGESSTNTFTVSTDFTYAINIMSANIINACNADLAKDTEKSNPNVDVV